MKSCHMENMSPSLHHRRYVTHTQTHTHINKPHTHTHNRQYTPLSINEANPRNKKDHTYQHNAESFHATQPSHLQTGRPEGTQHHHWDAVSERSVSLCSRKPPHSHTCRCWGEGPLPGSPWMLPTQQQNTVTNITDIVSTNMYTHLHLRNVHYTETNTAETQMIYTCNAITRFSLHLSSIYNRPLQKTRYKKSRYFKNGKKWNGMVIIKCHAWNLWHILHY